MIDQLIDVISQEAILFEEFLGLLDQQKEALVANDIEKLNSVTKLQQSKLLESQKLNRKREHLLEDIRQRYQLEGDVTVSTLAELTSNNQSAQLKELRDLISGLDMDIHDARNRNALLINQSREFIARTMEMLSRMASQKDSYERKQNPNPQRAAIMLDRRV